MIKFTESETILGIGSVSSDIFALHSQDQQEAILARYGEKDKASYLQALKSLHQTDAEDALAIFQDLSKKHKKEILFSLAVLSCLAEIDLEKAQKHIEKIAEEIGEAEKSFLEGVLYEKDCHYKEAMQKYEFAVKKKPDLVPAIFRLAYLSDLRGEEMQAIDLYEKCANLRPLYTNALINLGVAYEDENLFEKAIQCYQRILSIYPNHARARLYLRDAEASLYMYLDEEKEKLQDKHNQILATPISEFELSVRSKNCLSRMKIKTLGSLVKKTEAELLSYKNFGETSLAEIKEILNKKGLSLGMNTDDFDLEKNQKGILKNSILTSKVAPKNKETLSMPIAALEFSVRSRKCLENLDVITVGDLTRISEADLLSCKNFGQTSMQEIKRKLEDLGLCLAPSPILI